jgi:malate dehydrogenase (oxaloacetate-decarboxylating)
MVKGKAVLHDPLLNKGLAFTEEERTRLGLHGLLPYGIRDLEQQVERRYEFFSHLPTELGKSLYLSDTLNRNETVFYRLVLDHLQEMMPLIYTPTVGEVSLRYSSLYSHPRGLYVSFPLKDRMDEMLANATSGQEIDVIVATDGERILGLGDLGAGGMAISVGKLCLYTLLGGIHPSKTLPVMLDVGTNRKELLDDPMYMGWRHTRIDGAEYDEFIDQFVSTVKRRFPKILLQWEDFGKGHARPLLERYRHKICSFNDDMQGTAAVTLAAIMAAVKAAGSRLEDQKIAIVGAGTAGLGIADQLRHAMVRQGLSADEAKRRFFLFDRIGLIHEDSSNIDQNQQVYARSRSELSHWNLANQDQITLLDLVKASSPTVLIGVSGQSDIFTQDMIVSMAKAVHRPIIFPLSNPTSCIEAHPQKLIEWTKGKAIVATGSPFAPVKYEGKSYPIAQCNNSNIFPGLGLGIIAVKAREVSDEMFMQAAETLSALSPLNHGGSTLFPALTDLRKVSREIAINVAKTARDQGLTDQKMTDAAIAQTVDLMMWSPEYNSPN